MKKIHVIYDAKAGFAVRDGDIEEKFQETLKFFEKLKNSTSSEGLVLLTIATEPIITRFRIAIKKKEIAADEIEFFLKEGDVLTSVKHEENGKITHWPKGFCNVGLKLEEEFLWGN